MVSYYTDIPFFLHSEPRTTHFPTSLAATHFNNEKEEIIPPRACTPPNMLPVISRILVLKSSKCFTGNRTLSVFDTNDHDMPCHKCNDCILITAHKISDFAFGSSYLAYSNSGCIKIQKLHSNCVILSLTSDSTRSPNLSGHKNTNQSFHSYDYLSASPIINSPSQFSFHQKECEHFKQQDPTPISRGRTQSSMSILETLNDKLTSIIRSPDNSFSLSWDCKDTTPIRTNSDCTCASRRNSFSATSPIPNKCSTTSLGGQSLNFKLCMAVILHEKDENSNEIYNILNCMELDRVFERFIEKFSSVIINTYQTTQCAFFDCKTLYIMCKELRNELSEIYQTHHSNEIYVFNFNNEEQYNEKNNNKSNINNNNNCISNCNVGIDIVLLSHDHLFLLVSLHKKLKCDHNYNFFLSRLLTSILTHHHSWISSVSDNYLKLLSRTNNITQPMNSYMQLLASLYGYSPISPTLCKVILAGHPRRSIHCKLAALIKSYFNIQVIMPKFEENHINPNNNKQNSETEDFLIISLGEDSNSRFGRVSPYVAPSPNDKQINYYTYNENYTYIAPSTNDSTNYISLPEMNENAYSFLNNQIVKSNKSTVGYCTGDVYSLLADYLYEINDLFRYEGSLIADTSSSKKRGDSIESLSEYECITPVPIAFIVVNTSNFVIEVYRYDVTTNPAHLTNLKPTFQHTSKLINTLIESICTLADPVKINENTNNKQIINNINMEISLILFEKGLAEIFSKATYLSKHLTDWLNTTKLDETIEIHQFLSEVINLLTIDRTDLEILLRITSLIIPEENTNIELLIAYILAEQY